MANTSKNAKSVFGIKTSSSGISIFSALFEGNGSIVTKKIKSINTDAVFTLPFFPYRIAARVFSYIFRSSKSP